LVVEIHRMRSIGLVVVIEIVVEIHRMTLVDLVVVLELVELVVVELKVVVNRMMIELDSDRMMRSFLVVQVELVVMGVEFDYHIERWLDVELNRMKIVDHNLKIIKE